MTEIGKEKERDFLIIRSSKIVILRLIVLEIWGLLLFGGIGSKEGLGELVARKKIYLDKLFFVLARSSDWGSSELRRFFLYRCILLHISSFAKKIAKSSTESQEIVIPIFVLICWMLSESPSANTNASFGVNRGGFGGLTKTPQWRGFWPLWIISGFRTLCSGSTTTKLIRTERGFQIVGLLDLSPNAGGSFVGPTVSTESSQFLRSRISFLLLFLLSPWACERCGTRSVDTSSLIYLYFCISISKVPIF